MTFVDFYYSINNLNCLLVKATLTSSSFTWAWHRFFFTNWNNLLHRLHMIAHNYDRLKNIKVLLLYLLFNKVTNWILWGKWRSKCFSSSTICNYAHKINTIYVLFTKTVLYLSYMIEKCILYSECAAIFSKKTLKHI